jgi:uncharacterized protein YaiE (UPF0345 family)
MSILMVKLPAVRCFLQTAPRRRSALCKPVTTSFGTEAPELMELLGGAMEVKLAGEDAWTTYQEGESFNVPGNSKFSLKVKEGGADYCCSYLS